MFALFGRGEAGQGERKGERSSSHWSISHLPEARSLEHEPGLLWVAGTHLLLSVVGTSGELAQKQSGSLNPGAPVWDTGFPRAVETTAPQCPPLNSYLV